MSRDVQIDLLELSAMPEPICKYASYPAPLAVHADADVIGFEHAGELGAGELAAALVHANCPVRVAAQQVANRECPYPRWPP